mmetsp:Transcript_46998/g.147238  ORF Transcript_46998/g.147238 Transcript_46998/m.147238 type:complete len:285 (-) Transcript_46998:52-906(-)
MRRCLLLVILTYSRRGVFQLVSCSERLMIKGIDDVGRFYTCHEELLRVQNENREKWYEANREWWVTGYGGTTDSEAMVGDDDGEEDCIESLRFLDRMLEKHPGKTLETAIDAGAGVGRVTRAVLLRRCKRVMLIEGDSQWSKQSKMYLGKKRAMRCEFKCARLDDLSPLPSNSADLVWIQWTLQYLTDQDVIKCLESLSKGLRRHGFLIVKENRPYGHARNDRFQMDTPDGENGRYDITRTDVHHRILFEKAGLTVEDSELGMETCSYCLRPKDNSKSVSTRSS